jgi:hypothetical protein
MVSKRVDEALLFIQEWTRGEKIMAPRSRGGKFRFYRKFSIKQLIIYLIYNFTFDLKEFSVKFFIQYFNHFSTLAQNIMKPISMHLLLIEGFPTI